MPIEKFSYVNVARKRKMEMCLVISNPVKIRKFVSASFGNSHWSVGWGMLVVPVREGAKVFYYEGFFERER